MRNNMFLNVSNGVAGDMILGTFIDFGASPAKLIAALEEWGYAPYEFITEKTVIRGVSGTRARIVSEGDGIHVHTAYQEIKDAIEGSPLPPKVKSRALHIYGVIAGAEATVHETTMSDVHFHEVGRPAAVMTIAAAAYAFTLIDEPELFITPLVDGSGTIEVAHGIIPVPVPAVAEMAHHAGLVIESDESVKTEMITPQGLAILIGCGASVYNDEDSPYFEPGIAMTGAGFGWRDTGRLPAITARLYK